MNDPNYYEQMPFAVADELLIKMEDPRASVIIGFIDTMIRMKFKRRNLK